MDFTLHDPRIDALARALRSHRVRQVPPRPGLLRAAVALLVRPDPPELDLLLIKRAARAGDPWSGHMALPGGRRDPADANLLETAERETFEEVGIDLRASATYLGPLDDVQPLGAGVPPLVISPHAFVVPGPTVARPNHEVEAALWVPLSQLAEPVARAEYLHALESGQTLRFPALRYQGHVIWGLTYRILTQFLSLAAPPQEAAE